METTHDLFEPKPAMLATPAVTTATKSWYRLSEVPVREFLKLIRPVYEKLYGDTVHDGCPDEFDRGIFHTMTDDEYREMLRLERKRKSTTMEKGYFHQNLLGTFPGWTRYVNGSDGNGGLDIGNVAGTIAAEVKNQDKTMNSDALKSVRTKLETWTRASPGRIGYIILVNGTPPNHKKNPLPANVRYLTGRQAYAMVSGRDSCYDDVLSTWCECFKRYPSLEALNAAIAELA